MQRLSPLHAAAILLTLKDKAITVLVLMSDSAIPLETILDRDAEFVGARFPSLCRAVAPYAPIALCASHSDCYPMPGQGAFDLFERSIWHSV